jgi:mannose-6-phosphate isomerase-like protein (cupin superfamily)
MPENPSPISVRLRCEQTKSRRALMENRVDADFAGPPLHVHPDFDETFHVLEGELTFQLGDQRLTAGAGALVVAPGETPHTYANLSREEARPLLLRTPAGFERYFDRPDGRRARGFRLEAARGARVAAGWIKETRQWTSPARTACSGSSTGSPASGR